MDMNINRMLWNSMEAFEHIRSGKPAVLLNCPLVIASEAWAAENLHKFISSEFKSDAYISQSNRFMYWDNSRNQNGYGFQTPTTNVRVTLDEFNKLSETNYIYFQQSLVAEMKGTILQEYEKFDFKAALVYKMLGNWDELSHNLLLCGKKGYTTPSHFDEQQNLFAQLHGYKRVRLHPPENWTKLYPYPLGHPCDRQIQVTLPSTPGSDILENEVDRYRFPNYDGKDEVYVDLAPGEVLYIPQYWFHQMEGLTNNTSLSWWFKHSTKDVDVQKLDLSKISLISVRRNLEKLMGEMVGNGKAAQDFFLALASGVVKIPSALEALGDGKTITSDAIPTEILPDTTDILLPVDIEAKEKVLENIKGYSAGTIEKWEATAKQAVIFASMILKPEDAPAFIRGIVAGRFNSF